MAASGERTNQKTRTRRAIIDACRELMHRGQQITMAEVAKLALVSEGTAYRYFPDVHSLLSKALAEDWPSPQTALQPVAASSDPVERVAFATRYLLEGIALRQTAVRAMMAVTITRPELARTARPGIRFGLIAYALDPFVDALNERDPARYEQLSRELAVIAGAEALFALTDLCELSVDDAIETTVRMATTVTRAAFDPEESGRCLKSIQPPS
jgi:AcrR family transcriptional regulator